MSLGMSSNLKPLEDLAPLEACRLGTVKPTGAILIR